MPISDIHVFDIHAHATVMLPGTLHMSYMSGEKWNCASVISFHLCMPTVHSGAQVHSGARLGITILQTASLLCAMCGFGT